MNSKDIVAIHLIPENPQHEEGVTRIEQVILENENGSKEIDNRMAFEYCYTEDNSEQMLDDISHHYDIEISKITIDWE